MAIVFEANLWIAGARTSVGAVRLSPAGLHPLRIARLSSAAARSPLTPDVVLRLVSGILVERVHYGERCSSAPNLRASWTSLLWRMPRGPHSTLGPGGSPNICEETRLSASAGPARPSPQPVTHHVLQGHHGRLMGEPTGDPGQERPPIHVVAIASSHRSLSYLEGHCRCRRTGPVRPTCAVRARADGHPLRGRRSRPATRSRLIAVKPAAFSSRCSYTQAPLRGAGSPETCRHAVAALPYFAPKTLSSTAQGLQPAPPLYGGTTCLHGKET